MTQEPISLSGALTVVLTTGVALVAIFYPGLTQEAQVAIIAFGNSLIVLGAVIYARARSTPLAAPIIPTGTTVTVTNPSPAVPDAQVTL